MYFSAILTLHINRHKGPNEFYKYSLVGNLEYIQKVVNSFMENV